MTIKEPSSPEKEEEENKTKNRRRRRAMSASLYVYTGRELRILFAPSRQDERSLQDGSAGRPAERFHARARSEHKETENK